jgi:hypothetical protein
MRDFAAVERTIHGTLAVISAPDHKGRDARSSISAGMDNIIMAMEQFETARRSGFMFSFLLRFAQNPAHRDDLLMAFRLLLAAICVLIRAV